MLTLDSFGFDAFREHVLAHKLTGDVSVLVFFLLVLSFNDDEVVDGLDGHFVGFELLDVQANLKKIISELKL